MRKPHAKANCRPYASAHKPLNAAKTITVAVLLDGATKPPMQTAMNPATNPVNNSATLIWQEIRRDNIVPNITQAK
jgi:hypothetical protein